MKIVCLVQLLFFLFNCQSGGFRGGGVHISSGAGLRSNYNASNCQGSCYGGIIVGVAAILAIIAFIVYKCQKVYNEKNDRKRLYEEFINSFNTSNESQLKEIMNKINQTALFMSYIQYHKIFYVKIEHLDIRLMQIDNINQNPYLKLEMKCNDQNGNSVLKGAIKQSENLIKILLLKDYENKSIAHQEGDFSILICEGQTQNIEDGFDGKWYFYNTNSNGNWMWSK